MLTPYNRHSTLTAIPLGLKMTFNPPNSNCFERLVKPLVGREDTSAGQLTASHGLVNSTEVFECGVSSRGFAHFVSNADLLMKQFTPLLCFSSLNKPLGLAFHKDRQSKKKKSRLLKKT